MLSRSILHTHKSINLAWRRCLSAVNNQKSIIDVRDILKQHVSALKDSTVPYWNARQTVGTNPVSASRDVAIIPLGSNRDIRLEYLNYRGSTRFGQILEDLDTFAVWLAYKHNQPMDKAMGTPAHHPMLIVTACVDRIDMQNMNIRVDEDIEMHGFVSWVGRSSIESTMTLKQKDERGDLRDLLTARFVMASRSPDGASSVPNLGMELQTAEEKQHFDQGKHAHRIRRERECHSLLKVLPTEIERTMMHDLFLKTLNPQNPTTVRGRRDPPPGHVWMRDARLKNSLICYPVERNLYGKIFGGYIMRSAMETAWANAAIFSKSRPKIMAVGHINFRKPIEVGGIALFNSQVCYSSDRFMQISVETQVLDVETQNCEITNTFQFTFKSDHEVPLVVPKSYADGILYLDARRHFSRSAHLEP